MRDFLLEPQYQYCAEQWLTLEHAADARLPAEAVRAPDASRTEHLAIEPKPAPTPPRVLILFGSETGTAESAARRCASALRLLRPTLASLNDHGRTRPRVGARALAFERGASTPPLAGAGRLSRHDLLPRSINPALEETIMRRGVATKPPNGVVVGAACSVLAGCAGLLGWSTGERVLISIARGWPGMVPNTAIALVLAGLSLWSLGGAGRAAPLRWAGQASAAAVTAFGPSTCLCSCAA
ncbi:hypothetical protein [Sorangium sp. So ce1097]|uniref:hypothetical protein n=1 Tax=Sorangium sp. So ce1097 TaxID=3133330 RepID=UPI003F5FCAC6